MAGALDQLAVAQHLHLTGVSGYVSTNTSNSTDAVTTAHGCGAASTTRGISQLSASVLSQYGLTRPFPGKLDVVELANQGCGQQTTDVDAGGTPTVGLGNMNVHLVPMTGGPAGSLLGLLGGGGTSALGESAVQVGCQIYSAWKSLHTSQQVLFVGLLVASDESAFGQNIGANRTDPSQSVGVFQQISSDGWGTIPEEMNVESSAEMFFLGGNNDGVSTEGLIHYYGLNPNLPPWELAQETQVSGAGQDSDGLANYGAPANMSAARQMLSQITSGGCKNNT